MQFSGLDVACEHRGSRELSRHQLEELKHGHVMGLCVLVMYPMTESQAFGVQDIRKTQSPSENYQCGLWGVEQFLPVEDILWTAGCLAS